LGRRLRREREAEDLLWLNLIGSHQPDDPRRHDRCFASTGASLDHEGLQRRDDRIDLFIAKGSVE